MRRNKHKHTRRAVTFYKLNYGFHEPFKVLLDGNFIHAAHSINLGDLEKHLSNLLGAKIKLYITKCVTQELQSLGPDFVQAAQYARKCDLHKCGHDKGQCTPGECLSKQIGQDNIDRWWVATQDPLLRDQLEKIPCCPVIFATINGVHLHEPPGLAKAAAKEAAGEQQALPAHEKNSVALQDLDSLHKGIRTTVKFRKHKAKGPNPLSVKKKQIKVVSQQNTNKTTTGPQSNEGDRPEGAVAEENKAKRKRKRGKNKDGQQRAAGEGDS